MYKALVRFVDLQDNGYAYNPGDTFPRTGLEVSKERLLELSTSANRKNAPVIELVESPKTVEKPKKVETPKEEINKPEMPEKKPVKRGRKKKDAE